MRRDQRLVDLFIAGYNKQFGTNFKVVERPDETNRAMPAIEAIAHDPRVGSFAIEHTLVQPFMGEKEDNQRFNAAIACLERDVALRVPGHMIMVSTRVGAIPKGKRIDWDDVGNTVEKWFEGVKDGLPEGGSVHSVPNLPFLLEVSLTKKKMRPEVAALFVMRTGMPDDFGQVVRRALETKLPKLTSTPADKRALLLEMDSAPRSPFEVGDQIGLLQQEFPHLREVDEAWCALTLAWETEGIVHFFLVWPQADNVWFEAAEPSCKGSSELTNQ
jgi:hypothetical protein